MERDSRNWKGRGGKAAHQGISRGTRHMKSENNGLAQRALAEPTNSGSQSDRMQASQLVNSLVRRSTRATCSPGPRGTHL